MYIGAWTEYRLAQEHLLNRRRLNNDDNVPEQPKYAGSGSDSRKGIGIYHPSLAEKGGTEVTVLPNRESFRKSLESALSSNLAADDVEHITRALEPLMQRLPTIGNVAHKRRERMSNGEAFNRRKVYRCMRRRRAHGSRMTIEKRRGVNDQVRSDAGTRLISEGTGSARSGFSTASAPTASHTAIKQRGGPNGRKSSEVSCCETADESRWEIRGRNPPEGKVTKSIPHLPLIVSSPRAPDIRTTVGSDNGSYIKSTTAGAWDTSMRHAFFHQRWKDTCLQFSDHDRSVGEAVAQTRLDIPTTGNDLPFSGGYDSVKAMMLLQVARKRQPAEMKANFQHFWTWKRDGTGRPHGTPLSRNKQATISHAATTGIRAQDHSNMKPSENGARKKNTVERCTTTKGDANVIAAKLEALERMKEVYLAKGMSSINIPKDSAAVVSKVPKCTENESIIGGRCIKPVPAKTTAISKTIFPRPPEGNCVDGVVESPSTTDRRRGQASASPDNDYDLYSCDSESKHTSSGADGLIVVVPDLELTESRIRLVNKYFGGGGLHSGEVQQDEPPLASEAGAAALRHVTDNRAKDMGDGEIHDTLGITSESEVYSGQRLGGDNSVSDGGNAYRFGAFVRQNGGERGKGMREARREKSLGIISGCFPGGCQGALPEQMCDCSLSGGRGRKFVREICKDGGGSSAELPKIIRDEGRISSTTVEMHRFEAGKTPPQLSLPMEAVSPCALLSSGMPLMAPTHDEYSGNFSPSLEDLVCWTKGLNFEAAVEGF